MDELEQIKQAFAGLARTRGLNLSDEDLTQMATFEVQQRQARREYGASPQALRDIAPATPEQASRLARLRGSRLQEVGAEEAEGPGALRQAGLRAAQVMAEGTGSLAGLAGGIGDIATLGLIPDEFNPGYRVAGRFGELSQEAEEALSHGEPNQLAQALGTIAGAGADLIGPGAAGYLGARGVARGVGAVGSRLSPRLAKLIPFLTRAGERVGPRTGAALGRVPGAAGTLGVMAAAGEAAPGEAPGMGLGQAAGYGLLDVLMAGLGHRARPGERIIPESVPPEAIGPEGPLTPGEVLGFSGGPRPVPSEGLPAFARRSTDRPAGLTPETAERAAGLAQQLREPSGQVERRGVPVPQAVTREPGTIPEAPLDIVPRPEVAGLDLHSQIGRKLSEIDAMVGQSRVARAAQDLRDAQERLDALNLRTGSTALPEAQQGERLAIEKHLEQIRESLAAAQQAARGGGARGGAPFRAIEEAKARLGRPRRKRT